MAKLCTDLCPLMNRVRLAAILLLSGWSFTISSYGAVMKYSITPDSFQRHVNFLAADEQGGRGLGTPGIERSADYIANHLASSGLEPAGDNGTYFQAFEVSLNPKLSGATKLEVVGDDTQPSYKSDFVPFGFSGSGAFEGDVVFAGYGIVNDDQKHNDYAHFAVEGKVVLMLRHEPPTWTDDDSDFTPHAQFSNKIYNAKERGAAAVMIVNRLTGGDDRLQRWGQGGGAADYGLPAFHVSQDFAGSLLEAGGVSNLQALQDQLDSGKPASEALKGVRVKGNPGIVREKTMTRNVLGLLKGTGPLAQEIVVIGAHYDHLGKAVPRSARSHNAESTDQIPQIHNGADDNASGTAGVIELARKLASQRPLKRSVLFMAFSGEESGLLGSKHFVAHPTVDLKNVVAMLNMDMIGRLADDNNTVQVFGTEAAEGFAEMLESLAKRHKFELKGSASATGPSDHSSFYQKKIPSLHFFSGLHEDYHRPSDDADKVNTDKSVRFLAYIEDVAKSIIDDDRRPVYHYVAAPAQVGASRARVRMGIMPSYADDGKGLGVDAVMENSPAVQGGMKDGDVIVRIGETKVKNIYDYMAALRDKNPGDTVEVEVVRDGKAQTLSVELGG